LIRACGASDSESGNSGYRRDGRDGIGSSRCFDNSHRVRSEKLSSSDTKTALGLGAGGSSGTDTVPALLRHEWRIVDPARDPTRRPAKAAPALIVSVGASSDGAWRRLFQPVYDDAGYTAGRHHLFGPLTRRSVGDAWPDLRDADTRPHL